MPRGRFIGGACHGQWRNSPEFFHLYDEADLLDTEMHLELRPSNPPPYVRLRQNTGWLMRRYSVGRMS